MRSGKDLLEARALAADQRVGKERVAIEARVLLEADANGQGLRQKNLSGHAVHIPRVPPLRKPVLDGIVFGRTSALPREPRGQGEGDQGNPAHTNSLAEARADPTGLSAAFELSCL